MTKSILRKRYRKYCNKHKGQKIRTASDKAIKITLEQEFGAYEIQHLGDTNERGWQGFNFKDNSKPKIENINVFDTKRTGRTPISNSTRGNKNAI